MLPYVWPQDNDRVVISSDEELAEAVALATRAGKDRLTLHVTVDLSSAAANASSASYVGSAAMLGNRGPSGSSLPAGGGAMDDDAKLMAKADEIFETIDTDGNKVIDTVELSQAMAQMGVILSVKGILLLLFVQDKPFMVVPT